MSFDWVGKEGTKAAKRAGSLVLRERKKRNEIEDVLEIWRTGTGTQIVHWGTLAGESDGFGIAASVPKTS